MCVINIFGYRYCAQRSVTMTNRKSHEKVCLVAGFSKMSTFWNSIVGNRHSKDRVPKLI